MGKVNSESSPIFTKGISRSFLTPCRRVGLSRIKKLSNSVNSSFSDDVNTSNSSTPASEVKIPKAEEKSDKSRVSKRLITEDDEDTPLSCLKSKTVSRSKKRCSEPENVADSKVEVEKSKVKSKKSAKKVKTVAEPITDRSESVKIAKEKLSECISDSNETVLHLQESVILVQEVASLEVPQKSNKNTLNQLPGDNTNSNEKNMLKEIPSLEEFQKSLSKKPQSPLKPPISNKKTFKRSLSMKKSTSDGNSSDCALQDTVENVNIENLPEKINILKKQMKEKQKLLDDLQRAETYKKIHNLEELQQLTTLWKNGCISALNDLLPQLQKRTTLDSITILNNLGIRKEIIDLVVNENST